MVCILLTLATCEWTGLVRCLQPKSLMLNTRLSVAAIAAAAAFAAAAATAVAAALTLKLVEL